ncbi:hypothetical protein NEHOM01_1645 [Nematocida homosporus]|uniref:uncharacterized protein n=1 Tax=Nematocida homosporus TaxID=1912981 RepID=UPI002221094D|nr:uncharacterized protein NEHOM01_1645 [Nematocida homosporus]KAI5186706.1 hypothetical protein NEHOM01_1645 [Nematocida homosporus]
MPGMSLKLVLAWLCFVLVRFGVVVGSSNPATNSDAMRLEPNTELSTEAACLLGADKPCVDFDRSGIDNPNTEMSEHQAQLKRERMTTWLECLGIFQPLVGDCLTVDSNSDWVVKLASLPDKQQILQKMRVWELIEYLKTLKQTPGVKEIVAKYTAGWLHVSVCDCRINPISNVTNTSTKMKLESYKQCLKDLQPLKKISSPDCAIISGLSFEVEILDQLELLLYLLRIMDVPIITIDWADVPLVPVDLKSLERFSSLMKDVPKTSEKRSIEFYLIKTGNHEFWEAFGKLIKEHCNIKVKDGRAEREADFAKHWKDLCERQDQEKARGAGEERPRI